MSFQYEVGPVPESGFTFPLTQLDAFTNRHPGLLDAASIDEAVLSGAVSCLVNYSCANFVCLAIREVQRGMPFFQSIDSQALPPAEIA